MCWSAEVSFQTFVFGICAVFLAHYVGGPAYTSRAEALFCISFLSVQLFEGFVWLTLGDARWNTALSIVGTALILFQPLATLLTIRDRDALRRAMLLAYLCNVAATLGWIGLTYPASNFQTLPAANGHLRWKWLDPLFETAAGRVFLVSWAGFFMAPPILNRHYINFSFRFITAAVSFVTYREAGTVGSMWCYLASLVFAGIYIDILILPWCLARLASCARPSAKASPRRPRE